MGRLRKCSVRCGVAFFLFAAAAFGESGADGVETFRYLPHWIPQAQFAGFYFAQERGFFEEEGLSLEVLEGGPERSPEDWLREGRAEFSTLFLSQAIRMRSGGLPVVNVAQLLPESSLLLIAHADSGIREPADLDGRKVAVWPEFSAQPLALFKQLEISPQVIEQGASLGVFLWRGVDAICAMRYNELQHLYLSGYEAEELVVISLEDYNVGFPEDGIYVLEHFRETHPKEVRGFVRAVRRGWEAAFANPEKAIELVMERAAAAGIMTNSAHQHRMLEALRLVYQGEDGQLSDMKLSPRDFYFVRETMQEFGAPEEAIRYEEFYRP